MCDLGTCSVTFKGVVVERPLFVLLFTISYFTVIRSMSINLRGKANQLNTNNKAGYAYCVYLERSHELDCTCQVLNENPSLPFKNSSDLISLANFLEGGESFKSLNTLRTNYISRFLKLGENENHNRNTSYLQQVVTIKIHSCNMLHMVLDFRPLPMPLYRLLIEDVEHVKIEGVVIRQNETVDVWFRRINGSLVISGEISCPECTSYRSKINPEAREISVGQAIGSKPIVKAIGEFKPKVNLRVIDAGNITFSSFGSGIGFPSDVFIKLRNAESVVIKDSFFNELPSNGLEIFNVDNVTIYHSEFYNGSSDSIVVNGGVKTVHVKDCLMDKQWLLPLNRNATDVFFRCTTSPMEFLTMSGTNYIEKEDPECISTISKWIGTRQTGVESTGAVVLAVISSMILLIAVGFLFVLHRSGRLDRYI